jgi:hypothetical protein
LNEVPKMSNTQVMFVIALVLAFASTVLSLP